MSLASESTPVVLYVSMESLHVLGKKKQEARESLMKTKDSFQNYLARFKLYDATRLLNLGVCKTYALPKFLLQEGKTTFKKLKSSILKEFYREWSSPTVLVPKPKGSWRFSGSSI